MLPLRSDAGRQSRIAPSTVRPSLSPGPKTPQGGMLGGENFRSPARTVATPSCARVSSASGGYAP
eukprot:5785828-Pleurochrysis_carterae.AAC.1